MTENRRLGAVLFLDMVGYSALMSRDQASALACVRDLEALVRELVPAKGGRLVKFLGDGTMAEFPTPKSAFECAQAVHERIRSRAPRADAPREVAPAEARASRSGSGERYRVRVGLHLGELVEDKGDLFGDAVNIAARVMPLADPGGSAMTEAFHAEIKNQFPLRGGFLPARKLKNIPGRASVFAVAPEDESLPLWTLRRRLGPPALTAAGLALAIAAAAGWLHWREGAGPVRVGLLYIQTEGEALKPLARKVEDELAARVGSSPGFLWVARAGILDLFDQEGLTDLSQIEKLERKACSVARKGGLHYSLVGQLEAAGADRWRLESRIVCTKSRAVVGTFASVGAKPEDLAADHRRQLVTWADGYDLIPKDAQPALP